MKSLLLVTVFCFTICLGSGCNNTEYGCCKDEKTPALGPNQEGCSCDSTEYGCCWDGITKANGKDFEGCDAIPLNLPAICTLEKDRGSCRNFTVKWYFERETGLCSRFWYSGCDGNANRFETDAECSAACPTSLPQEVATKDHSNCIDNSYFANCEQIVKGNYCHHQYYAKFCCKSCTEAGQLPSQIAKRNQK